MEEQPAKKKRSILKKIRKIFLWLLAAIFFIFLSAFLLFKIPAVQDWAAQKVTAYLTNKLNTKVEVGDVTIELFSHIVLNEVYIEDLQKDTLLYAKKFEINLGTLNPFSPKVKIKKAQLENAYINIYRNNPDTVFNYQFIIDAFASKKDDTSASKPMEIDLQRLVIEKTRFIMHDEIDLSEYNIYLDKTDVKINELNLIDRILALESFEAANADIRLTKLFDTEPDIDTADIENYDTVHISLDDWIIEAAQFNLNNCAFYYKDKNSEIETNTINFSDLEFTNIDMDISEFTYIGDTIQANINQIALQEKSGFRVDTLQAAVLFSPYEITLNALNLKTPYSHIRSKYSMQFNTLNDFNRYEESVTMNAEFINASISTKDLAYFVSDLKEYNAVLNISSSASGTLGNLKLKGLKASLNDVGGIEGELSMKGLPDINNTFIDVQMKPLYVDINQLNTLLGGNTIPENIMQLGEVKYTGRFTGFINDFVVSGNINSSAGDATTDVNYKYDNASKTSIVDGHITTSNLNVGKLTGNEDLLGEVSADAELKGSFTENKINAELQATVNKININNYTYQNIIVEGNIQDKLFDGYMKIDDENLKQEFTGKIDLNSETPTYDFVSNITYANLGKLNLYKRDIEISAKTNINVKGKSLENISGDAIINDVYIKDGTIEYNLKSFTIQASGDSLNKLLTVRSDLVDADFSGNFSLEKLPAAIQDMINIYVKGGEITSDVLQNAQNVNFKVQVKDANTLTQIFYPEIENVINLKIEGDLNTIDKRFYSRTTAEKFIYNGINLNNTAVEIVTINNKLTFFARAKEIIVRDGLLIPTTELSGDFSKDSLNFNLKVGRDTDPERLNLYAGAFITDSIIRLNILPSEIYLNNEKWNIEANNSLQYDYESLIAENFTLQNNEKSIGLTGIYDPEDGNVLKFQLNNILIQDITQLIKYDNTDIEGIINANLNMSSNFAEPSFIGTGTITDMYLNDRKLGYVDFSASLLYPNEKLNFNLLLKGENNMRINGFYSTSGSDSISADALITKVPLTVAEPFTSGLFSGLYGDVSGDIKLRGTLNNPVTNGIIEIRKGGLIVDYLGTQYDFIYQKFIIEPQKITITENKITDKYKNEGILSGSVKHQDYKDFYFDRITIVSDKLLFMETTQKQNPSFFGKAIGKANVVIDGPLEDLNILVNAKPLKDNTTETIIYLPAYGTGSISKHNFIKFVDRSDTSLLTLAEKTVSVVNFDMRLDITPDAKIVILLSSEGSDTLVAKGYGNLQIEANTIDKLEITGTLSVADGSYNFSFENLINKEFKLKPGGTIKFEREPYKAELNLTAIYTAHNVKESSLTGNPADIQKRNVDVFINITGVLESPEINFDLKVEGASGSGLSTFDQNQT
ncbi:MAG: translocation/assembly module TamB domain-containing protein, partial [Fimbriimonadaceae bacterium]|nr:translocation/assembly module TamB domain-containing protein [Chitinophagales bacterium]